MSENAKSDTLFVVNDAYLPFLDSTERVQLFYGGAASGKSTFLAQRCVLDLLCTRRNYLVLRAVGKTLRHSVVAQLMKAVRSAGAEEWFRLNVSEGSLTCLASGGQALFAGLDDAEKLKSVTPENGVLTDIWVEEAAEVDERSYKQLTKRLRGVAFAAGPNAGAASENKGEPPKRITLSFNPDTPEHWIWKSFFAHRPAGEKVHREEGLLVVKTTHGDNRFLTREDRRALESEDDRWFYEVYTAGNWAAAEGAVFKNWRVCDFEKQVAGFDNLRCGLDFGFADDPNALVVCHVDVRRKRLYVLHEFVQSGLHDDELAEEVKERVGGMLVVCDSAEPKAISDLCRRGVRAVPAVKGPDSVRFGIRFLQGFEILVSPRCPKTAAELGGYRWQVGRKGGLKPRPEDKNNHLMDALRYAVEDLMLQSRASAAKRL